MTENPGQQHGHGHQHDRGWRAAACYLRYFGSMWMSPVNREVIRLLDVRPAEHVLDIGAGMGPGAVLAAKAGARVVAVDPTPFMRFVLGLRRLWQPSRDRLEILNGTAEQLPLPDVSVDAAWAVNAMHHWSDLGAGISELARVLRPGGRLLLVDEDFDDPSHQDHKRFSARRSNHDVEFADVDPAEVGRKLVASGFVVDEAGKTIVAGRPAKLLRATKS